MTSRRLGRGSWKSTTRSRARRAGALGLGAALLLVSACSVGGPAAGGEDSRSVRLVVRETPSSMDPCDSHQAANGPILIGNITEPLTNLDVTTGELTPGLASEWTETNPTTWRFTLRQGVMFHDGQPFNADAVAKWVQRVVNPDAGCYVLGSVLDENVVSATAVDEHTVDIGLTSPDPILPIRMSFVDIGAPTADPMAKAKEPVGTGPFKFVSWSPGANLEMTRFDGYWGQKPEVEGATYMFRAESSVRAAMASAREVDIATAIGPQDADMPGALNYTVAETMYFRSDLTLPPLSDIRVRRAMNYAVDRQAFINNVYGGNGEPASDIVLPTVTGYNPDVTWNYDPDKARQLLAEAAAAGTPVDAPIQIISERDVRGSNGTEAADTISAMLQAVGLNTHVVNVEDVQDPLTAPEDPAKEAALVLNVHGNSLGDAHISLVGKLGCSGPQSRLCDQAFDAMLVDAGGSADAERESKLQAASKYVYDNVVPLLPVAHLTDTMVITNQNLRYEPNSATSEKLVLSEMTFEATAGAG
jgi:peptide/nickel transport system substrate-binding protein